jgi:hypothetical protein
MLKKTALSIIILAYYISEGERNVRPRLSDFKKSIAKKSLLR